MCVLMSECEQKPKDSKGKVLKKADKPEEDVAWTYKCGAANLAAAATAMVAISYAMWDKFFVWKHSLFEQDVSITQSITFKI